MLIGSAQLLGLASSVESEFVGKLVAQQAGSFPQLAGLPPAQATALVAASTAVAQFHGFDTQQEIAVCASCVVPFVAGGADASAIQGEGGAALQTLVADTKSVLGQVSVLAPDTVPGAGEVAGLLQQCGALAAVAGSNPINIDRSGPVVPFMEQSPVKPGDLLASACSALPAGSRAASGSGKQPVTQTQVTAAAATAQNNFPDTVLGQVVQNCKPLVDLEFRRVYWDGTPIPNIPYTVTLSDGSTRKGTTDGNGLGAHSKVPPGYAKVVYGENKNPAKGSVGTDADPDFQELFSHLDGGAG